MTQLPTDQQQQLEHMIDAYGVNAVLVSFAVICRNTASALRVKYQDDVAAGAWETLANRIDRVDIPA